ncbi:MAG: FkbM family methyltransferase, partial [Anaerolineales bacterium]
AGYPERGDNWGLSRLVERAALGDTTFKVSARPLDAILDEHGADQVDLLKMDIEGAEELALRGMRAGLARHRYCRILLEVHPTILAERGRTVLGALHLLMQAGYRAWWIDHSLAGTRRAAYCRSLKPRDFLRPEDFAQDLGAWPHMLWLSPGLELLI